MKTLLVIIVIALVIIAGYYGYKSFGAPSETVQIYQKFATLITDAKISEAQTLATDKVKKELDSAWSNPSESYKRSMTEQVAGKITGVSYDIESEVTSENGNKVTITAVQKVSRYRAGDRALGGGVTNLIKQKVELIRDTAGWKVSSFTEEQVGNQ